jgi:hypothetical protein
LEAWAEAQPSATSVEGVVVALEDGDIVVDVAGKRGAANGDVVEIWRPIKLKHPVTGKTVSDRFRIGSLTLTQVRDSLSLARPDGKLARVVQTGDVIILRRVRLVEAEPAPKPRPPARALPGGGALPPAGAPPPESTVAQSPADGEVAPQDPDALQVTAIFDALKGADLARRIVAYEDYVRENPEGKYAVVLWEEAAQLRRLLAHDSMGKTAASPRLLGFELPKQALDGIPLTLGVELEGPAVGAVLHARRAGEVAFRSSPMRAAGPGYFTVTVPAERMRAPAVEIFIEATTADGKTHGVVGASEEPKRIEVEPIPAPTPPPRKEATLSLWTDYADYNRMKGNDVVWQTEGFVGMRFGDEGLRALRTGFGVFRGVGGSLEELDELGYSGRKVGLTYGYLEGEAGLSSFTSLIFRGVIGLKDDGVSGGAQALVRIGNDKKTNLQIGGEVLGGVGLRGITQLDLNIFERIPIMFRTEVTNQPAGTAATKGDVRPASAGATPDDTSLETGEVGARAIAQVGYRVLPGFVVAARGSYQGRNIRHAGPGFGGAVTYTW